MESFYIKTIKKPLCLNFLICMNNFYISLPIKVCTNEFLIVLELIWFKISNNWFVLSIGLKQFVHFALKHIQPYQAIR